MADTITWKIYLFKGDKYVQIDQTTGKIEVGPSSIGDDWEGLKDVGFDGDLDAAAYCQNRIFFFKGKQYAMFDAMSKSCTRNGAMTDFFKSLPNDTTKPNSDFTQDIDAATLYKTNVLYLFKGNNCVTGDPTRDPESITVSAVKAEDFHWAYPFTMGVQAAPSLQGISNTFIRGDSAVFYATSAVFTLECLWPGLRDLGFDRGIDAAVVLDWELNPPESEPVDD
jgi:hypothetical protein